MTLLALSLVPLGTVSSAGSTLLATVILCAFLTFVVATGMRSNNTKSAFLPSIENTDLLALTALPSLVCLQTGLGYLGTVGSNPLAETMSSATMIIAFACFYALTANSVAQTGNLKVLLAGLVAIISLEAAYGVLNLLAGNERLLLYKRWAYFDSATGTLVNRNHFAYLMELGLPLSIAFASWFAATPLHPRRESPSEKGARKMLIGTLTVLTGLGLIFSRSRMGMVSLVLAAVVVSAASAALRPGHGRRGGVSRGGVKANIWLAALVIVSYAAAIGLDPILERFFSIEGDLEAGRIPIWQTALAMFYDRPLLGHGWGSFAALAPGYRPTPTGMFYTHAHSEYLEIAAEAGIAGIVLVAWMIFLFARRLVRTLALPLTPLQRTTVVALGIAVTSVLLHSAADFGLRIPGVALAFVYVVALFVRVTDNPSLVDGLTISRKQVDR